MKVALAGEIIAAYVRTRWLSRRRDLRSIVSAIRTRPCRHPLELEPKSIEAQLIALRLGNAVNRTLRVLPADSRCLMQALVLSQLLGTRGIPSTLVIGAHSKPDFAAHAWLEHEGRPVLSPRDFGESRLIEI